MVKPSAQQWREVLRTMLQSNPHYERRYAILVAVVAARGINADEYETIFSEALAYYSPPSYTPADSITIEIVIMNALHSFLGSCLNY